MLLRARFRHERLQINWFRFLLGFCDDVRINSIAAEPEYQHTTDEGHCYRWSQQVFETTFGSLHHQELQHWILEQSLLIDHRNTDWNSVVNEVVQNARNQTLGLDRNVTDQTSNEECDDRLLQNRMSEPKQNTRYDNRFEIAAQRLAAGQNESAKRQLFEHCWCQRDYKNDRPQTRSVCKYSRHDLLGECEVARSGVDPHHQIRQPHYSWMKTNCSQDGCTSDGDSTSSQL